MDSSFTPQMLALGMIWYVVFLFSTTCHEGAHALAAKLGGDPTAALSGQASLNPIPHIQREPIGMVAAPLISYLWGGWMIGWASAPYDPLWQQCYPRRAALMALAGPAANFTLMLLAAIAIRLGVAAGWLRAPDSVDFTQITEAVNPETFGFVATSLSVLFSLNLLLGTFNLIPVPPLDGNTAITLLMSQRAALRFLEFTQNSGFALIGLIVAWQLFGKIFWLVFPFALALLYPGMGYGAG
jgi:Zn-dependent protease